MPNTDSAHISLSGRHGGLGVERRAHRHSGRTAHHGRRGAIAEFSSPDTGVVMCIDDDERARPVEPDPRDVFLTFDDLLARYGLGKTCVGQLVKHPRFAAPTAPGRWRLDHVRAAESVVAAAAESAPPANEELASDGAKDADLDDGGDADLVSAPKKRPRKADHG